MVIAKKEPPSDGKCGFLCNQPGQQVETAGVAVMFNLHAARVQQNPLPLRRGANSTPGVRTAVPLRCIAHQAPIGGGQPLSLFHERRVEDDDYDDDGNVFARQPQHSVPGFVFACGAASQLAWRNIMG